MINYIQLNQNIIDWNKHIINNLIYEEIDDLFKKNENTKIVINHINKISINYNEDKLYLIKGYLNYFIRNNKEINNINEFIENVEILIHNNKSSIENILLYFINVMKKYYN